MDEQSNLEELSQVRLFLMCQRIFIYLKGVAIREENRDVKGHLAFLQPAPSSGASF